MFFDLPQDPTKKKRKKKAEKKAKGSKGPTAPRRPPRKKPSRQTPSRRRRTPRELIPSDRPRRIAVPTPTFEKFLRAGDWPGGGNKKSFTCRGITYWPWLVLENKVAARVVKRGKQGAVVEFVRQGSPLDQE